MPVSVATDSKWPQKLRNNILVVYLSPTSRKISRADEVQLFRLVVPAEVKVERAGTSASWITWISWMAFLSRALPRVLSSKLAAAPFSSLRIHANSSSRILLLSQVSYSGRFHLLVCAELRFQLRHSAITDPLVSLLCSYAWQALSHPKFVVG